MWPRHVTGTKLRRVTTFKARWGTNRSVKNLECWTDRPFLFHVQWITDLTWGIMSYCVQSGKWIWALYLRTTNGIVSVEISEVLRNYFSPERLNQIHSKYSKCCPRRNIETGTLLHMFWACTRLNTRWNTIAHTLSSVIKSNIHLDPALGWSSLLGSK